MIKVIASSFLLFWAPAVVFADACTERRGFDAENEVITLTDWRGIYVAYKKFSECDDGSVAEGFSDRVVHLLATNWSALSQLETLIRQHPKFGAFVIRHVDATADTDELGRIVVLATSECPRDLSKLCADLNLAATQAIKEDKEFQSRP